MIKLRKLQWGDVDGVRYLVDPDFRGKGIATEAAKRLLDFGFGELGLHRIRASALPENPASGRVLEKAATRKEGLLLGNLKIHGVWKSSFLYAMLAEEHRPVNPIQGDPDIL